MEYFQEYSENFRGWQLSALLCIVQSKRYIRKFCRRDIVYSTLKSRVTKSSSILSSPIKFLQKSRASDGIRYIISLRFMSFCSVRLTTRPQQFIHQKLIYYCNFNAIRSFFLFYVSILYRCWIIIRNDSSLCRKMDLILSQYFFARQHFYVAIFIFDHLDNQKNILVHFGYHKGLFSSLSHNRYILRGRIQYLLFFQCAFNLGENRIIREKPELKNLNVISVRVGDACKIAFNISVSLILRFCPPKELLQRLR